MYVLTTCKFQWAAGSMQLSAQAYELSDRQTARGTSIVVWYNYDRKPTRGSAVFSTRSKVRHSGDETPAVQRFHGHCFMLCAIHAMYAMYSTYAMYPV